MIKRISFLFLIILLLVSCNLKAPIKVAFVGGISGKHSELGVASRNAFLLKVDEVNDSGGINGHMIEPHIIDDQNDPDLIPEIYNELRSQNIEFVVGHILSSMAESVLKEAAKEDILIFSSTMSTDLIQNKDDFLIRSAPSNSYQAIELAKTVNSDGSKTIIIVTDQRNKAYTEELADKFTKHYDGIFFTVPYSTDDESATTLYETVQNKSPDAVLLITSALDTALMSQHIKQIDHDINLYSVSWSISTNLIHSGGNAVEGMKIVHIEHNTQYENKNADFELRYQTKYNEETIFVSNLAYEISSVMFESMGNVEKISPTLVKNAIINHTFEGIENDLTFNEFGDRPAKYQIFQIVDGEFKILE